MEKIPLLVIAGPTASGKTGVAVELALALNGEVVSADSMQVYRGLTIGTAKATAEERRGVPHHLIDVADPGEDYSVVRYQQQAREAIRDIAARGRLPILAGGTGFYINAVVKDTDFTEEHTDPVLRQALYDRAAQEGPEAFHARLAAVDPAAAAAIHPHNVRRVARALEYFRLTGERLSEHNAREAQKEGPYDLHFFVLTMERARLYARIEERIDEMMAQGLLDEAARLLAAGYPKSLPAMRGLGYKELFPYLEGECSLDEAVTTLKTNTRRYAKRQLTWFAGQTSGTWIDRTDKTTAQTAAEILAQLRG